MGEAKRRQKAPLPISVDYRTGKQFEARRAGSLFSFLKNDVRYIKDSKNGRPAKDVPCAGCAACCYHACVDIDPAAENPEDLKHLDTVPDPKREGGLMLRKRDDGACVHLGPNGCAVYNHRPHACRVYDCRRYSVTGVLDTYDNGHAQPAWIFDFRTRAERCYHIAIGMGVARLLGQKKNPTATEALRAAQESLKEFLPIARQMVDWLHSAPRAEVEAFLASRAGGANEFPKEIDASEDLMSIAAE